MLGFENQRTYNTLISGKLSHGALDLDSRQNERFNNIKRYWNFYEGYHYEEIAETDGIELTINYCQAFVNKYVSFELGNGFTFNTSKAMNDLEVTTDGRTLFQYLQDVWKDNGEENLVTEIGQMKSVTGEAWIHVNFAEEGTFEDPFNEFPDGKLELLLIPSSAVFPDFNPHRRGELIRLLIAYQYNKDEVNPITQKRTTKVASYKQIWTKDTVVVNDDGDITEYKNKYETIPFVPINNIILAGRNEGRSDLEDLIPLNTELNLKSGDVSEVIDYHSAPVTVVYGAKIGNLEKGANKIWGGLPKTAKVENLEMHSELGASTNYISMLKRAMCEVGNMPESALGGAQNISNTSGVALQYANLPLIERTATKKNATKKGIQELNKMIIYVSLMEGLIKRPSVGSVSNRDFYYTEVDIPDTLPKDYLLELQQIQIEMANGLEDRQGAMKRLGRNDIDAKLKEIDEDREKHPDLYSTNSKGNDNSEPKLNSGITNGSTTNEEVNKEVNGENKYTDDTEDLTSSTNTNNK